MEVEVEIDMRMTTLESKLSGLAILGEIHREPTMFVMRNLGYIHLNRGF
jgi:hypothetical protein